jgi:hypothetical protein
MWAGRNNADKHTTITCLPPQFVVQALAASLMYINIYIYREREREREKETLMWGLT